MWKTGEGAANVRGRAERIDAARVSSSGTAEGKYLRMMSISTIHPQDNVF